MPLGGYLAALVAAHLARVAHDMRRQNWRQSRRATSAPRHPFTSIEKGIGDVQSECTSLQMWSRGSGFGFLPGAANGYSLSDMKESSK